MYNRDINIKRKEILEKITTLKEVQIIDTFDYEGFKKMDPTEQCKAVSEAKWSKIVLDTDI